MLARYMRRRLSVRLTICHTLQYYITQITPHDSPRTQAFSGQRSPQNMNGVTHYGGDKCRWGRLRVLNDETMTIKGNVRRKFGEVRRCGSWDMGSKYKQTDRQTDRQAHRNTGVDSNDVRGSLLQTARHYWPTNEQSIVVDEFGMDLPFNLLNVYTKLVHIY